MSLDPGKRKAYAIAIALAVFLFDVALSALLLSRHFNGDRDPTPEKQLAGRVEGNVSDSASPEFTAEKSRSNSPSAVPTPSTFPSPSVSPSPTEFPSRSVSSSPSGSPAGSPPPSSATPALHLRLPTSSTAPSTTVKVKGRYVGADPGTRLLLERRNEGRWFAFPLYPVTREGGHFNTFVDLIVPGSYELRVRDPWRGVTSEVAVLRIG